MSFENGSFDNKEEISPEFLRKSEKLKELIDSQRVSEGSLTYTDFKDTPEQQSRVALINELKAMIHTQAEQKLYEEIILSMDNQVEADDFISQEFSQLADGLRDMIHASAIDGIVDIHNPHTLKPLLSQLGELKTLAHTVAEKRIYDELLAKVSG